MIEGFMKMENICKRAGKPVKGSSADLWSAVTPTSGRQLAERWRDGTYSARAGRRPALQQTRGLRYVGPVHGQGDLASEAERRQPLVIDAPLGAKGIRVSLRTLLAILFVACGSTFAANDDLSATLSKGLFEEEANHNLGAAIEAYQSVIDRFDTDRKLAATAVFRLGECYRKQGSTNQATAQYQRILREFADQAPLVTLSRQNLAALRATQTGPAPAEKVAEYNQVCSLLETQRKSLKVLLVQFTPDNTWVKDAQAQVNATEKRKQQLETNYPGLIAANSDNSGEESPAPVVDADEVSRVEAIIKNSPDLINAPDQSGQTLLQTYAGRGDLAVVKLLLDSGAAVNGIRQPELTPLHYAAGNGHKAVVDLLLSKGAKTDVRTESGVMPLHIAVSKGYELVAKDLLEAGAPVNAQVGQGVNHSTSSLSYELGTGQTPLQIACEKGYHTLVDLLIARGADVNANNGAALNAAVSVDNETLVKTLLAAHGDPKAGDSVALKTAAVRGAVELLDVLLAHCVNPNLNSSLEAAIAGKHPAAVKELIAHKADANAKYQNGTPFIFSALSDPPTLIALLEGGADPNQRDPGGQPLLERAVSGNTEKAVEVLLMHGANPDLQHPTDGSTSLRLAASYGKIAAVKLLLDHGAKVNIQAKDGQTALHCAVRNRFSGVVEVLLDRGADPNLRDNDGQTALDMTKSFPGAIPFRPVPQLPGTPIPESVSSTPAVIADLLRQHGASEDMPRLDRIEIRRFPNYSWTVFSRSTNELNRFSLLEAIAVHYGFLSAIPNPRPANSPVGAYAWYNRTLRDSLSFPNLDKIEIRRPKPDGKDWTRIPVSVQSILESGDCSRDVWLQWGDQIEIPEADHPLDQKWSGFPGYVFNNLQKCINRQVHLTVKGQATDLRLEMPLPPRPERELNPNLNYTAPQFCLEPALQNSGLLRTSSDLSHVKVTRHNPTTGENWERTFDCSADPYPDLWLRDGDVIEVPDKP